MAKDDKELVRKLQEAAARASDAADRIKNEAARAVAKRLAEINQKIADDFRRAAEEGE